MGAYSRSVLIQGWALVKFSPFSASVVCLFCSKNETKKGFFKMINTLKKTPSSRKPLSTYSFLGGGRGKGCVLVVGAYLSLSERGTGWALIRGWALMNFSCL